MKYFSSSLLRLYGLNDENRSFFRKNFLLIIWFIFYYDYFLFFKLNWFENFWFTILFFVTSFLEKILRNKTSICPLTNNLTSWFCSLTTFKIHKEQKYSSLNSRNFSFLYIYYSIKHKWLVYLNIHSLYYYNTIFVGFKILSDLFQFILTIPKNRIFVFLLGFLL